jgi:hypothetical protein
MNLELCGLGSYREGCKVSSHGLRRPVVSQDAGWPLLSMVTQNVNVGLRRLLALLLFHIRFARGVLVRLEACGRIACRTALSFLFAVV